VSQPEFSAKFTLEATVSPSEDPAKVMQAMKNVVGDCRAESFTSAGSAKLVTGDPKALVRIRDQLRDRHVRSAARRQMILGTAGRTTSLMLNRQAAAAGVIAVCSSPEESPLGPIYLTIESGRLDSAIDWLATYPG
jgi:predicted RNA binding protein with dsRBD fold (UPF0201 family)